MLRTIERFLEFCRMQLQREPGMVTTCNMITLRPLILTLTFFDTCELFYLPMKTLHIPSHIVPATNDSRREISRRIVRDHPINVTVCGDDLEELHEKRHILEFHGDTSLQALGRPINVLQVNIPLFLRKAHQAIRFQCGVENTPLAMDIFEVGDASIP